MWSVTFEGCEPERFESEAAAFAEAVRVIKLMKDGLDGDYGELSDKEAVEVWNKRVKFWNCGRSVEVAAVP